MKLIDITGQRFGRLVAKEYIGSKKWLCQCDCGNTKIAFGKNLRRGDVVSCGCLRNEMKPKLAIEPGTRFGRLTAVEYLGHSKWRCKCDCGNEKITTTTYLRNGDTRSCGCLHSDSVRKPHVDMTGQKFGRLTVLEYKGDSKWLCKCDCGNDVIVDGHSLRSGNTRSCGCLHREGVKEMMTTHGLSKEPLYHRWIRMKQRCANKNDRDYKHYGGRGINVCDEWANSYLNFREWAFDNGYEPDLTIDRIDVNGDYCPENCRWITITEQARNKRNNRAVNQVDENGSVIAHFNTIAEASISSGCSQSKICEIASGKRRSVDPFTWVYDDSVREVECVG